MADRRHTKATKHDARRTNLRTTLEIVSTQGSTSRAEIARKTGLSRAAVSSLVGELIDQNLIRELGQGESAGGKPPTLLAVNERARDIVAIDLGHRPFQAALTDLAGHIHTRQHVDEVFPPPTGGDAVDAAIELIDRILGETAAPVLGIGVATPGVVDPDGVIVAPNLGWHGVELGKRLERRFELPVSIANDASMAALAEVRRHPTDRNFILVKIGRGVGAGLILDGSLYRGQHSAAGEIGHVRIVDDGDRCRCGLTGCLETVAGVPAILRRIGADPDVVDWDALTLAGSHGESAVREALVDAGRAIGRTLAAVVGALDVSHVILAPEVRNGADILIETVRDEITTRVFPIIAETIEVEVTQLGGDLVLSGAASAVQVDRLGTVLR